MKRWLKAKLNAFISNRAQPKKRHVLTRKNLYIFPSRIGFFYLFVTSLFWLLGTNYQNNLLLALSYLQLCVMLVSIFHCYFNMLGLKIEVLKSEAVFCHDVAVLFVKLSNLNKHYRQGITIAFDGEESKQVQWLSKRQAEVKLPIKATQRGLLVLPRLELRSYFPLGFLRCWCLLKLDEQVLVYPQPIQGDRHSTLSSGTDSKEQDSHSKTAGDEREFSGLNRYSQGDSISAIAWKQYARTDILYKKHYEANQQPCIDLNWNDYPSVDVEQKLRHLCFDALAVTASQLYSLQLPNLYLPPASGPEQLQQVLSALAKFEQADKVIAGTANGK